MVIPRRDVGIADRPVDADALALVRREVEVRVAIALPPPRDRPPADMIAADPVEPAHLGVGMLVILDEEVVPLVVDRVAGALLLEIMLVDLGLRRAPAGEAEVPRVLGEGRVVLAVLHVAPAFEDEGLEALLGQLLRRPAAG